MTNIVLLGGNGYIGRATTKKWMKKDNKAYFYVVSRSGNNELLGNNIINLKADVSNYQELISILPEKIDYIVDFVGRPEKDPRISDKINTQPALIMKRIAEEKNIAAMGFIGGLLGPKYFLTTKKELIETLKQSNIKLGFVEPTLVYGGNRKDILSKTVPLFKFLEIFSKNMRPIHVELVAQNLVNNILE